MNSVLCSMVPDSAPNTPIEHGHSCLSKAFLGLGDSSVGKTLLGKKETRVGLLRIHAKEDVTAGSTVPSSYSYRGRTRRFPRSWASQSDTSSSK